VRRDLNDGAGPNLVPSRAVGFSSGLEDLVCRLSGPGVARGPFLVPRYYCRLGGPNLGGYVSSIVFRS
jgi:hypothetical protein